MMFRSKGGILACAVLLDPTASDASGVNNFHDVGSPCALVPVLQDRHRLLPTPCPRGTSTHSAGNAGVPARRSSYRGILEGAIGGGGRIRRGWRNNSSSKAFVLPSAHVARPSALAVRAGRRRGEGKPWHQQRLPSTGEGVTCTYGRVATASTAGQPRRGFMRRCGAAVSMTTTNGRDGDDAAASSSRQPFGAGPLMTAAQQDGYARPEVPKWAHKAVIIPGFASDARAFESLCYRLERRGIASVVVPIRWYHWLPTLGGRSVRPILDRIHETVIRCVGAQEHKDMPYAFNEPGLQNEVAPYTAQDFWAEMGDPKRGAHHMGPLDLPLLPAEPSADERVILIAHSAGGWMSRIYLSEANYDGRTYNASYLVNGLVTLGTPHVRLEDDKGRNRDLPFSRNFKFVEDFCTGEEGGDWEKRIPTACVGGAALRGRSTFGGLFKDLVYQSYELCCGDGSGIGDGITPLESAFDMAGAKRYIELEGVLHAAGLGGPWYGSDDVVDSWLEPSLDAIFGPSERTKDDDNGTPDAANAGLKPSREMVPVMPVVARDEDTAGKDGA